MKPFSARDESALALAMKRDADRAAKRLRTRDGVAPRYSAPPSTDNAERVLRATREPGTGAAVAARAAMNTKTARTYLGRLHGRRLVVWSGTPAIWSITPEGEEHLQTLTKAGEQDE